MLYLVFLVLISVASVTPRATKAIFLDIDPELAPILMNVFKNCAEENGIDSNIMEKVMGLNIEDNDLEKKYLYCVAKKSDYGDDDGHLVKESFLKVIGDHKNRDQFINVIDECNKLKGGDKYDTVFKITNCFLDKSPVLFKFKN